MVLERDFIGLTALVTGASSGIGLEFSRQLATRGADVVLVSDQADELDAVRKELQGKYESQKFWSCYKDLCDADSAEFLLDFCVKNTDGIDILINNAGVFAFKEVCDMCVKQLNTFIDLHMRAVTLICRLFAEQMRKRDSGYILNMSSMSCWIPMPGMAMYSATKSYIQVFSRALNMELKDSGVSVTVACPGGIATDLFGLPKNSQRFAVKIGVLETPQNFVQEALKRMKKRKAQYVNGLLNKFALWFVPKLPLWVKMQVKYRLLNKMNTKNE